MATDFSVHHDPSGVFSAPSSAIESLEALNAAGYTARLTDEQPRGPYRRYTSDAPIEVVESIPGFVDGSDSITEDPPVASAAVAALLERAYDLALPAVGPKEHRVPIDGPGIALVSGPLLLAYAVVLAAERFEAMSTSYLCFWCQDAARAPTYLLAVTQPYSADEIAEHGPRCEHNPLTKAARLYFAALDAKSATAPAAEQQLRRLSGCPEVGS